MKLNLRNFLSVVICSSLLWWGIHLYHPVNSMSERQQIIHTVSRTSFGMTPQLLTTVEKQGLENYLQAQLNPASIAESPSLTSQLAKFETIERESADLYQTDEQYNQRLYGKKASNLSLKDKEDLQQQRNQHRRKVVVQARQSHTLKAINSSRQLQEVMTDFWLAHFNVFLSKKTIPFWIGDYENALRDNALGNFGDLLWMTAHHPAMLIYLDNELNQAPRNNRQQNNALNENYARELMELHTLGVDGGYTQEDVTTLARILTGWGVDYDGLETDNDNFLFIPERHDSTDKVFLGQPIAGGGMEEGEKALAILADSPATARHISYKLAQYFVSDRPPATLVDRLSKSFLDSQGNIKTVLDTLFHSTEFNDPQYYNVKFKTPFQYLVSAVRASGIKDPDLKHLESMLNQLAMPVFGCKTPDGYQNTEEAWLNPEAMLRRVGHAVHIGHGLLSDKKPIEYSLLQSSLADNLTTQTKEAVAKANPNLQSALVLGSPEMMYR